MTKINKSLYDAQSAGWLYSGIIILMLTVSLIFSFILRAINFNLPADGVKPEWYLYCGYLLPQFTFAVAIFLFFVFTDAKPKAVYQTTKWQYFLLAILLQFGLFSLSWLNNAFLNFLNQTLGYEIPAMQLPSLEGGGIVLVIFVVAFLPAVLEESIFRGLLLTPTKKFSTPVAILLSGLLFALYHQNPAQTLYQFCCGCAFALVAVRSNSVLPTMLAHFLNNAVIIVLTAFKIENFTGIGGGVFYVCSAVTLAACLVWLIFLDKKSNQSKSQSVKPFFFGASVGIAACSVVWLASLMQGLV